MGVVRAVVVGVSKARAGRAWGRKALSLPRRV